MLQDCKTCHGKLYKHLQATVILQETIKFCCLLNRDGGTIHYLKKSSWKENYVKDLSKQV